MNSINTLLNHFIELLVDNISNKVAEKVSSLSNQPSRGDPLQLLKIEEVMKIMDCSKPTIYNHFRNGLMKTQHEGHIRVRRENLEKYLNEIEKL